MRTPLSRWLRPGLPALAVLGLALAGCSDPAAPAAPEPSPTVPVTSAAPTRIDPGAAGGDGLTVRYLDGTTVKTLRVEDFPR